MTGPSKAWMQGMALRSEMEAIVLREFRERKAQAVVVEDVASAPPPKVAKVKAKPKTETPDGKNSADQPDLE